MCFHYFHDIRTNSGRLDVPELPPDVFGECHESEDITDDDEAHIHFKLELPTKQGSHYPQEIEDLEENDAEGSNAKTHEALKWTLGFALSVQNHDCFWSLII